MTTSFVIKTADKSLHLPLQMTVPQLGLSLMEASHG